MTPRVWNLRRGKAGIPKGAVYVGRPSPFGNPYAIDPKRPREEQEANVLGAFRDLLRADPALVERIRRDLVGKDLVCWCAPLPCHADILLRVAAGGEP